MPLPVDTPREAPGQRQEGGSAGGTWVPSAKLVECEVLPGLEDSLLRELERRFRQHLRGAPFPLRAGVRFAFEGSLSALLDLRTAHAAHLVLPFAGRRPTALLGHQNLEALVNGIATVRRLHAPGTFTAFRFGAAGRDSPTFRRLAVELEARTGLRHEPGSGELLIRVRPEQHGGWQALVRLSPRPLSTRAWRVSNLPGALNATIAAAMAELSEPRPSDRLVNLACGSGTLLVERLLRCPAAEAIGCDRDPDALRGAAANLTAAGLAGAARLLTADATATGLASGGFDAVLSDPPYGNLVGSHRSNAELYPALQLEAARLLRPDSVFVVITHELRLFEACLRDHPDLWLLERRLRVFQGGAHPQVYLLRRRAA